MNMKRQYFAASIALLFSIFYGICEGFSAVLIPQLQEHNSSIPITIEEASWIASTCLLPAPIGSLIVGILMEVYGRKRILQFSYLPVILGYAVMSQANSVWMLCAGRLLTGFAAGMEPAGVAYITEIVLPPNKRSAFLTLLSPASNIGAAVSYLVGALLPWRHEALFMSCLSALCFILTFAIPETPAWLLSKNKITETKESLTWLMNNSGNVEEEMAKLRSNKQSTIEEQSNLKNAPFLRAIIDTGAWKPFIIIVILLILQQFTGYIMQIFYAINFFESLGSNINSYLSSLIFSMLTTISSVALILMVNLFKRRTLMIVSTAGVGILYSIAAAYLLCAGNIQILTLSWLPTVLTWIATVFSSIGINSLPWLMAGELLPQKVRGSFLGLVWAIGFLFMFLSVKIYPYLVLLVQIEGIFVVFAASSFLALIFTALVLPETRGKTLVEIEEIWLPNKEIKVID